jgi:hypothetical protein
MQLLLGEKKGLSMAKIVAENWRGRTWNLLDREKERTADAGANEKEVIVTSSPCPPFLCSLIAVFIGTTVTP